MTLHEPFLISSRLLPAIKIGTATVSIKSTGHDGDGRVYWLIYIYVPGHKKDETDNEWIVDGIKSGILQRNDALQEGMTAFLSFLSAALESRKYHKTHHHNGSILDTIESQFDPEILNWAEEFSDEISELQYTLEENENLLIED